MSYMKRVACAVSALFLVSATSAYAQESALDIEFAGALEFADDGTLFVGDNYNGAIYAFEMPFLGEAAPVLPGSVGDIDAGVAHDNFLSSLRRMSYPFDGAQSITNVEMFHIAHDQYETRAPIRAMSIQEVDGQTQLIAAYTCSPIVLVPLEDIKDGAKIAASTIIDMGNGQPLDMIPFNMGEQTMLFVTNNSRSPQVIPVGGLTDPQVVTHTDFERGPKLDMHPLLPFGPVGEMVMFEGMSLHMDLRSAGFFVSLTRDGYTGSLNLDTNPTRFPNRIHNLIAEFDFPQWSAEEAQTRVQ